jgi:sugar phosphate isomerase/epimerase
MNRLGVAVCSFYPGYRDEQRPWEDILADSVATIGEMLRVGKGAGVTLAVEPHYATPYETVEQGRRLLEALPELTVAYDPSHYALQEIPLTETEPLLDRATHVHLRDATAGNMCVPYGSGTVDFDWILDALAERGYRGTYSIEYLPKEDIDLSDSIRRLRDHVAEKLES